MNQELVNMAQLRLARIDERHEAYRLHQSGIAQREIAAIMHTTQPRVRRMLVAAEYTGDTITPEEVILRATVDGTDRGATLDGMLTDEEYNRISEAVRPPSP